MDKYYAQAYTLGNGSVYDINLVSACLLEAKRLGIEASASAGYKCAIDEC